MCMTLAALIHTHTHENTQKFLLLKATCEYAVTNLVSSAGIQTPRPVESVAELLARLSDSGSVHNGRKLLHVLQNWSKRRVSDWHVVC